MIRLRVAFFVVASLVVPLGIHAQKRVAISGTVYFGDESHPAANIPITLDSSEQDHFADEVTNDNGQFRFAGLKPGTYSIRVDLSGYQPVNQTLDMAFFSDRGVKIYLKSISKQNAGKGRTISVHELSIPAKARELMDSGKKKLYQDKNSAGALTDFQQAISLAPGYYEAYYQVGMNYLTLGNRGEAEKSFKKSVEISGDKYGEADVGLGATLLDRGVSSEAEKSIRRGLQLNPNLWLGHYELGRALLVQKRFSEAELSADQARLLAPTVPIVYRLLSNIHLEQKNYPALIEDIDTYLNLDPDSPVGVRARQLRDQLQQKLSAEKTIPEPPKPDQAQP